MASKFKHRYLFVIILGGLGVYCSIKAYRSAKYPEPGQDLDAQRNWTTGASACGVIASVILVSGKKPKTSKPDGD